MAQRLASPLHQSWRFHELTMTPKALTEFLAETADQNQGDAPWEFEVERIGKVNPAAGPYRRLTD
jgi:hypothetical protein